MASTNTQNTQVKRIEAHLVTLDLASTTVKGSRGRPAGTDGERKGKDAEVVGIEGVGSSEEVRDSGRQPHVPLWEVLRADVCLHMLPLFLRLCMHTCVFVCECVHWFMCLCIDKHIHACIRAHTRTQTYALMGIFISDSVCRGAKGQRAEARAGEAAGGDERNNNMHQTRTYSVIVLYTIKSWLLTSETLFCYSARIVRSANSRRR